MVQLCSILQGEKAAFYRFLRQNDGFFLRSHHELKQGKYAMIPERHRVACCIPYARIQAAQGLSPFWRHKLRAKVLFNRSG
jgi:hypothetical protein